MTQTLSCSAVRELDRKAIEDRGIPSLLLMENAGRACAESCVHLLEKAHSNGPVLVLAGPGNNGGDSFVIARTLFNRGFTVRLFFIGDPAKLESLSAETQANARMWNELDPGRTLNEDALEFEAALADSPALVVDGMFGTGLTRKLRSPWLEVVHSVNESMVPVLAIDIPSGLHGDSGEVLCAAIRATETVTFVAVKPGLLRGEGPSHVGILSVAEIGIPRLLVECALAKENQHV